MSPYYQDDCVTLYHGDCLDVLPSVRRVDLVLTDPPYGVDMEYGGDYDDSWGSWQAMMAPLMRWCLGHSKAMMACTSKIEGEGWFWENFPPDWRLCWYKGAQAARCHVGFKDWEPIFVWGKCWSTPFHDHFHAPTLPHGTYGHPCPKHDDWARWLLSKATPNDVLDPFAGSGTTLRVCKDLRIPCIGIEREEKHCEIIVQRMAQEVLPL